MGRGRGATTAKDGGSKTLEKPSRATRAAPRKSYVEEEGSEEDFKDVAPSSPEVPDESESDYAAESSGSEYGKKKKKAKTVAPVKKVPAKRGRKPAGKAQLSPKKRPGRKPKAAASSNGKRKRPTDSSEDEEEKSVSSPGEVSEDDASGSGDTSGSEYGKKKGGKKLKKEKPPTRSQPRRQATQAPKKRGRKPKGPANGNKKVKLDEEEVEKSEEEMEIDEVEKKKSEDEGEGTTEDDVKEKDLSNAVVEKKKASDEAHEDEKSEKSEKSEPEEDEEEKKLEEETVGSDDEVEAEKPKEQQDPSVSATIVKADATPLMNRTETDYAALDFGCEKKTSKGDAWNFKIACWNVAGIRAWVKKNGLEYLKQESPDIICLQETKCAEKTKPPELKSIPDYPHTSWVYSEDAGHNGVATFSKVKPENVFYGIPDVEGDSEEDKTLKGVFNKEGRLIVSEFEKFYLVNAYVPNGGRGVKDEKHPKVYPPRVINGERLAWDRMFRDYVKSLEEKKPVIVAGDLNVAHEPIDLANPKTSANIAGFTKEERDGFTEFLSSTKLVDTFRSLYPEEHSYTFWAYMGNARQKNIGWRLDYFLLSEKLRESLCESLIRKEVYGSDHCPIVLFVHL